MDQIVPRVLQFDHFALDLTRGCLRVGKQDIDLRPKAYEVLRHLAENAGRLVPKQELCEAVWPNVTVTDDSLVQCIRELREKLGDNERRLIKTVSRRGYLLDTAVAATSPPFAWDVPMPREQASTPALGQSPPAPQPIRAYRPWLRGAAAASLLGAVLTAMYLPAPLAPPAQRQLGVAAITSAAPQPPPMQELFSEAMARRVAEVAERKELPLPAFQFRRPSEDISMDARRYVGVWVSDKGWTNSNRQMMLIITDIDNDGSALGYTVLGPPQPKSPFQDPAQASPIRAQVSQDALSFAGRRGKVVASLTTKGQIEYRITYRDGSVGAVSLDPMWTLVEAERATMRRAQ